MSPSAPTIPAELISTFRVTSTLSLQELPKAQIWQVETQAHGRAVLKQYTAGHMGNEAAGFRVLDQLQGPVVDIYQVTQNAALMEWLPGPSLGDISRMGNQEEADRILAEVATTIHQQTRVIKPLDPTPLATWFDALLSLSAPLRVTPLQRQNLIRGQQLAKMLLSSQEDIRPLHGDLHHENIREGARGYCAFDAKGLLGERSYELANALRHPHGLKPSHGKVDLLAQRAQLWGRIFDVSPKRLLQWGCAKSALSLVWRHHLDLRQDPEMDLLEQMLVLQSRL